LARFDDPSVGAVAPLLIDRDDPEKILSAGLSYSPAGSIGRLAAGGRLAGFAADDPALSGPELRSAFFRRDALDTIEGLSYHGSEPAVATDLALSLRAAGYRCVQEPASVITAAGLPGGCAAWCEGMANERLFRRWASVPGWNKSRLARAARLAFEFLQLPLRPSNLARLAGRFCAAMGFGAGRPVAIGMQAAPDRGAVIRPPHFGAVEKRPALQSRAAG
jgi:hypothetical protein